MTKQWFDVDRAGLGKQAEQHAKGRLIGELVQNALDEAGVTRIDVTLALVPGRPLADLTVEDDSPEGFRDLSRGNVRVVNGVYWLGDGKTYHPLETVLVGAAASGDWRQDVATALGVDARWVS